MVAKKERDRYCHAACRGKSFTAVCAARQTRGGAARKNFLTNFVDFCGLIMTLSNVEAADEIGRGSALPGAYPDNPRAHASAVSWGAILAGAAAAAALSLILLILGTGLGLSSTSPWAHDGVSATTFGVSTILWITFTQLAASGMGGYLAGRLRTKWVEVHTDEVYFRDTAHGFLAWAVASLATAALLTSVIGSIVSGGIRAGASVAGSVATTAATATAGGAAAAGSEMAKSDSDSGPMGYFVDSLFRKNMNAAAASPSEVARIFMNTIRTGTLPPEDVRYVGQVVAQRTGLTQQDAEKRVIDTYARMQAKLRDAETATKDAADKARKASAYTALWLFISLLIGAFVASLAATYGGRRRDA
jgi:hypothetical protein